MEQEKTVKKLQPTSNKVQISAKKDTGYYMFLSKLFLMDFEDIELHALGDAITICVKVGELLCRDGYTNITKIETLTIQPEDEGTATATPAPEGDRNVRRGKKAKLIIKLKRSEQFPEKIKTFKVTK